MSELENVKAVLDYLNAVEGYKKNPSSFTEWVKSEKERLEKEYFDLSIIDADDKDIISQALLEMSNKYNADYQFNVANKINEVRTRFLDDETEKFVKTNLNLYIKVKLNDYGKKIHRDYWKDVCRDTNIPYDLEIDEEGYSTFQMHDFIHTFGEDIYLGAKPVLETNNVLIERSK